jgi:ATP-dependent RNA helicase DeaD
MSEPSQTPGFSELGLRDSIVEALAEVGYERPSPIQAETIPILLEGHDLLGQASTGTGKTAAFALPVLSRIDVSKRKPQALVLTPTRELAIQVAEAFQKYAARMPGFHVLPIYGGQSYTPQLNGLKRGAQVIVGTPGRLLDHVQSGALQLDEIRFLVLDEGDEMLQMGFVDDIELLFQQTPAEKQVALFTATLPQAIRRIAQTHMREPREVVIQSRGEAAPKIRQRYWMVSGLHKLDALTRLLEVEKFDAMLVFVRTKLETVDLAQRLEARGFQAAALNGDMEQRAREQTVQRLKDGKHDIVIATDVAARGLDVDRISHVLNYDIPYDPETYVHRIGRTGRAGREGEAILFVAPRERNMLRIIERVTRLRIEEMKLPSIADVNELRVIRFKEKITEAVLSGAGRDFQPLLEQIEADANIPAIEIAAALASLMQGSTPLLLAAKPEREAGAEPKVAPAIDGSVPTSTYRIEVGHEHGVLPGNIVGAIANEAGVPGNRIGHIDIRDDHSYVDLPTLPDEVLGQLQKVRVRGGELRIARVDSKPDKPRFSGKSRRPDRMAEESGERKPYRGGGNRFERDSKPPFRDKPARGDKPSFGDRPAYGDKPAFRGKPSFGGKPAFGGKPGGFKKKFVGKAAGAKGAYKGGKAHRARNSD